VSTLSSETTSTSANVVEDDVEAAPTLTDLTISVSAKFLSPEVWRRRLTGLTRSSYSIGLLIVYERFWK